MKWIRNLSNRIRQYVFDSSIDMKDRAFVLFSVLVLLALFVAIPCGLIMREPLSATIATALGAVVFTLYVYISIKRNRIAIAKIGLSVIVVVIFLPAMFFTNGGVYGGTPIWLLLGTIYIALILDGKVKVIMIGVNAVIMIVCWIVGYLFPDLITTYSRGGNYFDSIAALFIVGAIIYTLISFQVTLFRKEEEDKNLRRLFEQTATALVNAIDAKDQYTHGHSARVAEYSKKIAEFCGKSPSECDKIYYVALLHDVGKIGIDERIINKEGKLTPEEYEEIKKHPVLGSQILSGITEYPDLIVGAHFHHERYDGKGYPDHLKGEDIPEIARIISVADAYDAMTSKRSYRATIPQQNVREEIVKGSGTQFDPKFAKIMQHLIDMDTEYEMKEKGSIQELSGKDELLCDSSREEMSEGILITREIRKIHLRCEEKSRSAGAANPLLVLFDSLDGRYHDKPKEVTERNYYEYASIRFNGDYECVGARKIERHDGLSTAENVVPDRRGGRIYEIEAVKVKDHIQIRIDDLEKVITLIIALPDSTRYAYLGLTGDNCHLQDVEIDIGEEVSENYIPRIAEEVSYIDAPAGDIPNVQVDGYRTASSEAVPVRNGMKLTFHTKSLPTARLIWHCPYLDLFYSPNKTPYGGDEYKEYALIRLDGEYWEAVDVAQNKMIVNLGDDFCGWDNWKEANKEGFDCTVTFKREENRIITITENQGLSLKVITTIEDKPKEVYVALTGDQCAITGIRVSNP